MRRVVGLLSVATLVSIIVGGVMLAPSAGAGTTKQFCASYQKFVLAFGVPFNEGTPTAEQIAAVQPQLDRAIGAAQKSAPSAITNELKLMADRLHAGLGGIIANSDPAFFYDSFDAADQWAIKHCAYRVLNITADDFSFKGVPKTVKPGFVALNVKNVAPTSHGIVVVRATGTETAAEIAALPLEEALTKVEVIASGVSAGAGKTVVNYADFKKPGRYAVVDPGHLAEKMYAEFKVKKG